VAHNGADGVANDLVPTEVGRAGQLFAPEVAHLEAMLGRNVFQLTLE